ncbi:AMP-binding protein [Nocardioides rotundus]|uniref:AMP-binding protein n=1 Tax=Nocardioides rotundus TaxID=1774216 RepID=UPI001CBCC126|nr:AMP-binding protein [Nocardioides rotundus]UAL31086.1 AMP-binding protein [Nocardioides rotundus]
MNTTISGRVSSAGTSLRVLARAGVIRPYGPRALTGLARTLVRWGTGPAGGFASLAARSPDAIGVVDELGELTWGEVHARSNAVAHALRQRGIGQGDSVAVMCRNHRGFIDAVVGAAKAGADVLLMNTAFAAPQLKEVAERERPRALIYDQEFTGLLSDTPAEQRFVAWVEDPEDLDGVTTVDALVRDGSSADLTPPGEEAKVVILTSGTTGTPKGAPRQAGIEAAVAILSRIPLRFGWRCHIAAPMFHTWGFAHLALSMLLGTTVVLRRRFDPEDALRVTQDERCDSMAVIPVMLQRILALPEETLDRYDLSRVQVVAASGSALPGDLAQEWMDRFGDNLYNTYGSTEVAYATIADPEDLRAAPGTAGRTPWSTTVRILDDDGREVPTGTSGRIFVGNGALFEGYTGGGHKEVIDGFMSTGDVGRLDDQGRLFVEGRDDEMIVSGGENVFPQEVEDCLVRHEAVVEAAAIGVDDEDFGQRLRAFAVLSSPGAVDEEGLKEWVKSNLARYKVPREIVLLDELPRNATGKVLKRELAEREE